jgi:hypothetical protein
LICDTNITWTPLTGFDQEVEPLRECAGREKTAVIGLEVDADVNDFEPASWSKVAMIVLENRYCGLIC